MKTTAIPLTVLLEAVNALEAAAGSIHSTPAVQYQTMMRCARACGALKFYTEQITSSMQVEAAA